MIQLIIALIVFLISSKGGKKNVGTSLALAAGAGLATDYALKNTEWGKDLSNWATGSGNVPGAAGGDTANIPGTIESVRKPTTGSGFLSGLGDVLSKVPGWALGAVGGAAVASSIPPWMLWGGIGLGAYLILKD